jgi:hypothetical protein
MPDTNSTPSEASPTEAPATGGLAGWYRIKTWLFRAGKRHARGSVLNLSHEEAEAALAHGTVAANESGAPKAEDSLSGRYKVSVRIANGSSTSRPGDVVDLGHADAKLLVSQGLAKPEKCQACSYKPCSVECFVKAGYKAENFDTFVAACEAENAERAGEEAGETKPTEQTASEQVAPAVALTTESVATQPTAETATEPKPAEDAGPLAQTELVSTEPDAAQAVTTNVRGNRRGK